METQRSTIATLRQFELSKDARSYRIIFSYYTLFLLTLVGAFYGYFISPGLVLLSWIPLFIFFCKFFIFLHDCEHLCLFKSRKMNRFASTFAGFFILQPPSLWQKIHNAHHGATGHLDERENNPGVSMKTVTEYLNSSKKQQLGYRFMTAIFTRVLLFPIALMIAARIPLPRHGKAINRAIILHNIFLLLGGILLYQFQLLLPFVFIYAVPLFAFYSFAAILFFLQHQFEGTYWAGNEEWDLYTASLQGSSYIKFGKILGWITGNVGCHHIHHINPKIPYFDLQLASDAIDKISPVPTIEFKHLFHHLRHVLWDEEQKRAVTFKSVQK